MANGGRFSIAPILGLMALVAVSGAAGAAQCGNTSAGFESWKQQFAGEARARGVGPQAISALMATNYATATISADRGQRSFRLSLDQFLAKRGGPAIVSRGRALKQSEAALFASIQQRTGVPPGPLLAIWGMETGFGRERGNQHTLSAVATLAYDCRRSAFFTDHLYAALTLIERGVFSPNTRGSMHGEVGHTQFLPKSVLNYGTGGSLDNSANALMAGQLPARAWLARRCRLPAGRAQLRSYPGLERRRSLPASPRPTRPSDRRRRYQLRRALSKEHGSHRTATHLRPAWNGDAKSLIELSQLLSTRESLCCRGSGSREVCAPITLRGAPQTKQSPYRRIRAWQRLFRGPASPSESGTGVSQRIKVDSYCRGP